MTATRSIGEVGKYMPFVVLAIGSAIAFAVSSVYLLLTPFIGSFGDAYLAFVASAYLFGIGLYGSMPIAEAV